MCRGDPWKDGQQATALPRFPKISTYHSPPMLRLHHFPSPQFWGEVEHTGMEVLEEEVVEKKNAEIFKQVAKACSVGTQVTLIVGGGALLFRCVNTITISLEEILLWRYLL